MLFALILSKTLQKPSGPEFIAVANVNARLTWHIQQISVIQGVQSLLSDNARQNDQTIGPSDSRKTKLIALVAQMVTTVFHQYEVGMREACIEAKVRKIRQGTSPSISIIFK